MIGPDHPDFENLPLVEQARTLRNNYGWSVKSLMEEYERSRKTIERWLNPNYVRTPEHLRQWCPVSPEEARTIKKMYASGEYSRRDLAGMYDRSLATIHKIVNGTPEPESGWKTKARKWPWERILKLHERGLNNCQIARRFEGLRDTTVSSIIKKSKARRGAKTTPVNYESEFSRQIQNP